MDEALLLEKIKQLPADKKAEVEDFTEFLLQKKSGTSTRKETKFGFARGMFTILPGFNDPIEGMEEYMQ
jgi:Protein of unknown function (DUF2281)